MATYKAEAAESRKQKAQDDTRVTAGQPSHSRVNVVFAARLGPSTHQRTILPVDHFLHSMWQVRRTYKTSVESMNARYTAGRSFRENFPSSVCL